MGPGIRSCKRKIRINISQALRPAPGKLSLSTATPNRCVLVLATSVLAFAAIWIIVPSMALNLLDQAVDLIVSI
jgi:hypothetical protein